MQSFFNFFVIFYENKKTPKPSALNLKFQGYLLRFFLILARIPNAIADDIPDDHNMKSPVLAASSSLERFPSVSVFAFVSPLI